MKILCAGGSMTNGAQEVIRYPEVLNTYPHLTIINGGKSGAKLDDIWEQIMEFMPIHKPDIVTILTGYNDLRSKVPLSTMFEKLFIITEFIKSFGAIPVLSTLTYIPENTKSKTLRDARDEAIKFNNILSAFCQIHDLTLVDNYSVTHDESLFWHDLFHLNNDGHKIVAKNFYQTIVKFNK